MTLSYAAVVEKEPGTNAMVGLVDISGDLRIVSGLASGAVQ